MAVRSATRSGQFLSPPKSFDSKPRISGEQTVVVLNGHSQPTRGHHNWTEAIPSSDGIAPDSESDDVPDALRLEEERMAAERAKKDAAHEAKLKKQRDEQLRDSQGMNGNHEKLDALLKQSKMFSDFILKQMNQQDEQDMADSVPAKKRGRGRPKRDAAAQSKISNFFSKKDFEARAAGAADDENDQVAETRKMAKQPSLVTGGQLRSYQLEGVTWLKSLYENGVNGILADEMGLGKTIQTIAFLAFLREVGTNGPFLIVAPLSTTSNWIDEFRKWSPTVPVVLYHGSKPDRAHLQETVLKNPGSDSFPVVITSYEICMNDSKALAKIDWKFVIVDEGHRLKNMNCRLIRELQTFRSANRLLITGTPLQNDLSELWSLLHFLMPDIFNDYSTFESWFDFSGVKDRKSFQKVFTDERESQLVGKLHGVLKPFLLRRVKVDVEKHMPKKREYVLFAPLSEEQRALYLALIEKRARDYLEETLFTSLMANQPVKSVGVGKKRKSALNSGDVTPNKTAKTSGAATPSTTRGRKGKGRLQSFADISDRDFFKQLDSPQVASETDDEEVDTESAVRAFAVKQVRTKKLQYPVMQLRLCCNSPFNFYDPYLRPDGDVEPLDKRLVSSSGKMIVLDALLPELFRRGHKVLLFSQFKTQLDIIQDYAEQLRNWRVCRIDGDVSQADRASQIRAFNNSTAIPGTKKTSSHRKSTAAEGNGDDVVDDRPANLFLLSTRAGGQGINLASADTVILFDSDWNPQQDLQAQDRAHRIGQTRNVIVYRFATRGTVEQHMLDKAEGKRRLEKLVIQKGGVHTAAALSDESGSSVSTPASNRALSSNDDSEADNTTTSASSLGSAEGGDTAQSADVPDAFLAHLREVLERADGEEFDIQADGSKAVFTKQDLDILMDRSGEAYERAEKGLDAGGKSNVFKSVKTAQSTVLAGMDG